MTNSSTLYDFLKSNGFKLVKQETSSYLGNYYNIFTNDIFELRFSASRSIETVDVRYIMPNENWYDIALVKALLYDEKKLNVVINIEEYYVFLEKELFNISKLFSSENYLATKDRLEILGNDRARQMFPGKVK